MKMSDKKTTQSELNKNNKCHIKCKNCHFYDRKNDYCTEKNIENCSKQINTKFSQCDSYLIKQSLIMF